MRVIIVEDEMLIAHATKMQLESNGVEILGMARDGEGFWKLVELNPDAILMDITLKGNENGVELVKELRRRENFTSVIFTTGNSRSKTLEEIESIPHACILSKPVVYHELLERINECCSNNPHKGSSC